MARDAGISVPASKVIQIGARHHTFLVKRFDRHVGNRKFFTSAMTLLQKIDRDSASYVDIAQFISENGTRQLNEDLRQLFTRVAFNIATANRDDHLRNHGFILTKEGWSLSMAYDMNPSTKKSEHVLGIDIDDHQPSLPTLSGTAAYYRLEQSEAIAIILRVVAVVATWEQRATAMKIPSNEINELSNSFITTF